MHPLNFKALERGLFYLVAVKKILNKHLILRFLSLVILYSISRFIFYLYHYSIFSSSKPTEILVSFLYGMRFDFAIIAILNLPLIFIFYFKIFLKIERFMFVLLNGLALGGGLADLELFSTIGKRMSLAFFEMGQDVLEQLPQVTLYYWPVPLGIIFIFILSYRLDLKLSKMDKAIEPRMKVVQFIFYFMIFAVLIRGGVQRKSINVQTAFFQGKSELGHLVLNTPYHFIRTLKSKRVQEIKYFQDESELKSFLVKINPQGKVFKKNNILIIIMEGFSLEYLEQGYLPELQKYADKGVFFTKHLANGRRSIEALPAILSGLPSLLEDPITKSIFQSNKFIGLPMVLGEQGYKSYFFHGGSRGTMGFESFSQSIGMNEYFGKEDYEGKPAFDGSWGIYDDAFFDFTLNKLTGVQEPFLGVFFSLSSHQPYVIPKEFKNKFPKGTLAIHESLGYADYSLGQFLKKVEGQSWFKNTIILITADHTAKHATAKFENMIGRYRVPLILLHPEFSPEKILKVTQHSDIPRSLAYMVGGED
jgi:phosphoglycerol transferase MdoB-like AlkP superfamily enzyme